MHRVLRGFWKSLSFAGLLVSAAAFSTPSTINPGDVLRIDVWNESTLGGEVLVRPDGVISLPMAGEIDTVNNTTTQVATKVAQALGKYMKDPPRVVVSLVNPKGNKIYVIGKVGKPGEYLITSDTDVMQALALAGGLNSFAAENEIRVLRRKPDGNQVVLPFRYARVIKGEDLDSNIVLQSRDVVVVP